MSHASITGMARAFLRHRGKAIALATLGHPAGEAVLPILAVSAAAAFGWRHVWLGAAALLVLAFPLLWRLMGRGDEARPVARGPTAGQAEARSYTRAAMLRHRRLYLIVPALIGPSFIVTGLFSHQVHLTEAKGWELSWFATCFAAYAGASTAALMLAGTLIDRLGAIRLMPIYLLPLCLGSMILALGSHDLVALAFMSLAGLTSGAAVTVLTAMWAAVYGLAHLGASLTVVSSALGPAVMGWLIDDGVSMEAIAFGAMALLVQRSRSWPHSCASRPRSAPDRGPFNGRRPKGLQTHWLLAYIRVVLYSRTRPPPWRVSVPAPLFSPVIPAWNALGARGAEGTARRAADRDSCGLRRQGLRPSRRHHVAVVPGVLAFAADPGSGH